MLLLNFSHPLPPDQLARLETLTGQPIERVVEIKTQVDTQAELVPQVAALADACGLSPAEWQQASILVLPPSLNFVAVTLLAELHGRMGYFPAHLRMRPVEGSLPPRFEVAEVINLQAVREQARKKR
jgi:hypothetical protein